MTQTAKPANFEPEANGILSARALTKVYGGGEVEVRALRGVDVDLHAGELVVLLGASGSGKSTLLNILGGLDVPTSGQVFFRGQEVTAFGDRALTAYRRNHVGIVFQFFQLVPTLTAQLSGGEQQRVAIARAIAKRPDLLLCDEPTGALDSKTGLLVLEAIETVNRELATATVLITHNAVIAGMADRVISMADGEISDVRRNPARQSPRDISW